MKTKHVVMKTLIFATALSFAFMQSATANPAEKEKPANAKVFYLGTSNDQYSVQLVFENTERDIYFVTLKDKAGNVLYSEKTTVPVYRKKFHFETSAIEDGEITVNVFSRKTGTDQKFVISKKVTKLEEVVITEINK